MVTYRWNYLLLICILMTLAMWGCENKESADEVRPELSTKTSDVELSVEGCWRSVKIEGADIGNFIKEIRYTFGDDGSFVAEASMTDGSEDKKEGTFRVDGNDLFRLVEGASVKGEFGFEDGKLMIYDPFLDTRIWFEKQLQ